MHHPIARLLLIMMDVLAFIVALASSAYVARYLSEHLAGNVYIPLSFKGEAVNRLIGFCALATFAMVIFHNRGHYTRRTPWWNQVRYVLLVCVGMMCVDGFVHFALKYPFSRLWILFSWVHVAIFILIARWIARQCAVGLDVWYIPTIVVGDRENSIDTLFALRSEYFTGYQVRAMLLYDGFSDFDRQQLPPLYRDIKMFSGKTFFKKALNRYTRAFYVLAPDSLKNFPLDSLVRTLNEGEHEYAIVPPLEGVALYGARPQYFFGHDVMFLWPKPRIQAPLSRFAKRAMDIVGSGVGLLLLSPLFLAIAWWIRCDGGAVFFAQKRIGKNGEMFGCLKFRSMVLDAEKALKNLLEKDPQARAEWERDFKLRNDPRITKVGAFLRKTSLDELPQLINVFKGEMSLVGPRPIVEAETKYYGDVISAYHSVRPGVTGLWQVSGRNDTGYDLRVRLDSWYVRNWSLWSDVVILFKTISTLVKKSGAY